MSMATCTAQGTINVVATGINWKNLAWDAISIVQGGTSVSASNTANQFLYAGSVGADPTHCNDSGDVISHGQFTYTGDDAPSHLEVFMLQSGVSSLASFLTVKQDGVTILSEITGSDFTSADFLVAAGINSLIEVNIEVVMAACFLDEGFSAQYILTFTPAF